MANGVGRERMANGWARADGKRLGGAVKAGGGRQPARPTPPDGGVGAGGAADNNKD